MYHHHPSCLYWKISCVVALKSQRLIFGVSDAGAGCLLGINGYVWDLGCLLGHFATLA